MEILGVALATIVLFVAYGAMVGIVFGFFGMGSFLVTPALIVMGYDSRVAVGSGLAFVFGTAVIGTLRHRDFGQVEYRLGLVLIAGTVLGIELGKRAVLLLDAAGVASIVVAGTYVVLLSSIGAFVVLEARGLALGGVIRTPAHLSALRSRLWSVRPRMDLRDGDSISAPVVFAVAIVAGVLSGFLGVGGGFLRMPALTYLFGLSLPVAVGTNIFAVMFSGAFGSFTWAQAGGVDLSIVVPLLSGSAMGARIGSALTRLVDDEEMKLHFGALLIAAAVAVVTRQAGDHLGIGSLAAVSLVVLLLATTVVGGMVVYSGVTALRSRPSESAARAD